MAIEKKQLEHIKKVAKESLDTFSQIASAAETQLADARVPDPVVNNTFTDIDSLQHQRNFYDDKVSNLTKLASEPALARVVVIDEDDKQDIIYILRPTTITIANRAIRMASYLSPMGRLASLPVSGAYTQDKPSGSVELKVKEYARFKPRRDGDGWDSIETILEGKSYKRLTVESLRALFKQIGVKDVEADLLAKVLADEEAAENIREGERRKVLEKMGLRVQPILDQIQDEIFRLPLDSQLLLLGAPGTGKTTTLIKRLRQKSDTTYLSEDEKRSIVNATTAEDEAHAQNWIMFTPTELLRLFVKEAFNREGVPAPDHRIVTWNEYRDDIARDRFEILRGPTGRGHYVARPAAQIVLPDVVEHQRAWFSDFDHWHKASFREELIASAKMLSESADGRITALGSKIQRLIGQSSDALTVATLVSLMVLADDIRAVADELKAASDNKVDGALNLQMNRSNKFLDELAALLTTLEVTAPDDADDLDAEEEEEAPRQRTGKQAAIAQYRQTVRAQARSRANRRVIAKTSRHGKVLEWLKERTLSNPDLAEVGANLLVQSALRRFINPVQRYIARIPAQYRRFRRARQLEGKWYRKDGFAASDIHSLELDLVLLSVLRETDGFITGSRQLNDKGSPAYVTLRRLGEIYRTQVLVDEATDFSSLQLAAMATLTRPGIRSFFACGDFNQRVTHWGVRTRADVEWAVSGIKTRTVTVAYRQSKQLHDFSKQIVALTGGEASEVALPPYVDNNGVRPVLVKNLSKPAEIVAWLGQRVIEIAEYTQQLPSIAILVNSEEEVRAVADALGAVLAGRNINVVVCPDGQVKGRDNDVRVFDVQHIKGLEFEAVFFVGIDQLASNQPNLFDKYLYVGSTRAATYLGITSGGPLPKRIEKLEPLFGQDWRQ